MEHFEPETPFGTAAPDEVAEYLFDMIGQMAEMARQAGQVWVAMHLDAIVIAQRAMRPADPEH